MALRVEDRKNGSRFANIHNFRSAFVNIQESIDRTCKQHAIANEMKCLEVVVALWTFRSKKFNARS